MAIDDDEKRFPIDAIMARVHSIWKIMLDRVPVDDAIGQDELSEAMKSIVTTIDQYMIAWKEANEILGQGIEDAIGQDELSEAMKSIVTTIDQYMIAWKEANEILGQGIEAFVDAIIRIYTKSKIKGSVTIDG